MSHSSSQAVDVDRLPQSFLKSALLFVGSLICSIFNKSLSTSTFPDQWKLSLTIPLNQVPTPKCLNDSRPISLLSFLPKSLERLVFNQLSSFAESKGHLDKFQTGFRPGHSTQTALLKLTDDIRRGMDRKLITAMVLFDFSKAFDSVSHVTLLSKLRSLGLSSKALRWIASYLSDRSQAVAMGTSSSTTFRRLNKGVPQGSVVGPLLFLLFINDIVEGLDPGVSHIIYADDLQIYVQGRFEDLPEILRRLSGAAERIADWATENHLKLNVSKTKAIVFGSGYYCDLFENSGITSVPLYDSSIPVVSSVRSLGVVLDARLNWKEHVLYICKRANSLMYRLNFFWRSTTLELRKHLIQTLLFPLVDYCSPVYCNLSGELNLKLQRVINRGIRYIFGLRRSDHVTPYRRELGWLRVEGRRNYFAACQLFKTIVTGSPSYLADFFLTRQASRPVRTFNSRKLIVPACRSDFLLNSFHASSTILWNSFPLSIQSAPSFSHFKTSVKNHIFTLEGEQ